MCCVAFFFFNDTATTEIYTLSLHDALPISFTNSGATVDVDGVPMPVTSGTAPGYVPDSECIECHAPIHATLKDHGMWLSAYKPSEDGVIEDFANKIGRAHV